MLGCMMDIAAPGCPSYVPETLKFKQKPIQATAPQLAAI